MSEAGIKGGRGPPFTPPSIVGQPTLQANKKPASVNGKVSDSKTSKRRINRKKKKDVLKGNLKDSTSPSTTCPIIPEKGNTSLTTGKPNMKAASVNGEVSGLKTSNLRRANRKKKKDVPNGKLNDSTTNATNTKTPNTTNPTIPHKGNTNLTTGKGLPNKSSTKVVTQTNPSNPPNPPKTKDTQLYKKKFQNGKKSDKIWFDGIDKALIEVEPNKTTTKGQNQHSENKTMPSKISFLSNGRSTIDRGVNEYIALDCEMVGTGDDGKDNMLARVSLVNQYGTCVYDKFVKAMEPITDYRTAVSGITPEKLKNGIEFKTVQKDVSDLIKGKILVGHAVSNDLKVLFLDHPRKRQRDTSKYRPFRKLFDGRTPSLKNLATKFLGIEIQVGSHSSVIDAQATMKIFLMHKKEWEGQSSRPQNKHRKK